jgi:cytochrome c-type biogenesis protein CcmH/NrfF
MQRHDVDLTSLSFGLLFTVAGLLLLSGNPTIGTVWLGWAGPTVAVAVGALVIFAMRPRRSNPDGDEADGELPAEEAGAGPKTTAPLP